MYLEWWELAAMFVGTCIGATLAAVVLIRKWG